MTVVRTSGSSGTVSVEYTTSNGTATAGTDYVANSGTLTFADGETSKDIPLMLMDDQAAEGQESFVVTLANPTGGVALGGACRATMYVNDDDNPGGLQFNYAARYAREGNWVAYLTVVRTGGASGAVSVRYSTIDGNALAGQDYRIATGVLTFADGETSKNIPITLMNDNVYDGQEYLNAVLSSPTGGATLGAMSRSLLYINDDDAATANDLALLQLYGSEWLHTRNNTGA
jgi:hypothetical protein